MFFHLEYIPEHPCNRMQEVIEFFFREAIDQADYGDHLFPEWFHTTIHRSQELGISFEGVFDALQTLTSDHRQAIYDQFVNNNCIEDLCSSVEFPFNSFLDWDSELGQNIKALFKDRLYGALDHSVFKPDGCNKKPKKSYYDVFLKKNKHVCPFCGMDKFPNPRGKTRSDLDHYLNQATYPFSAANLRNLVPMCDGCNQDYKKKKSVINKNGNRTPAFYPFGNHPPIYMTLECQNFPDNVGDETSWTVSLFSDDDSIEEKINTWDRVFEIKKRIKEAVEEYYEDWMDLFFIDEIAEQGSLESLDELREKLSTYAQKQETKISLRIEVDAIIKHSFFTYMAQDAPDLFLHGFLIGFNQRINQAA